MELWRLGMSCADADYILSMEALDWLSVYKDALNGHIQARLERIQDMRVAFQGKETYEKYIRCIKDCSPDKEFG